MTTKNKLHQAKTGEIREDLMPLINRLDDICDRLEFIESISELLYIWKQFDDQEITMTAKSFSHIGNFFREEAFTMRHEIACDIMERISLIEARRA